MNLKTRPCLCIVCVVIVVRDFAFSSFQVFYICKMNCNAMEWGWNGAATCDFGLAMCHAPTQGPNRPWSNGCRPLSKSVDNKIIFDGRQPALKYNFCTRCRLQCLFFKYGFGGWVSCFCLELLLLVLLGWKHSNYGQLLNSPGVRQLMQNGFQVSNPIMRITAAATANKMRLPQAGSSYLSIE